MADESFQSQEQTLELQIFRLLQKLDSSKPAKPTKLRPKDELKALGLWRAVIAECLASFLLAVLACGSVGGLQGAPHMSGAGAPPPLSLLPAALAAGLAVATLTHCFSHISGAHMNPAVTLGLCLIRQISPLRAALFVLAQCGGSIAGAALLYGVSAPPYGMSSLGSAVPPPPAGERFGVEFVLTFVVVFTYCVSAEHESSRAGVLGVLSRAPSPHVPRALAMGAAYSACSLVSLPYLNPSRALGPSFVLNRWELHWVCWLAPTLGGAGGAALHAAVFSNSSGSSSSSSKHEEADSSDDEAYDELDKNTRQNTNRGKMQENGLAGYCPSLGALGGLPPAADSGYCRDKLEQVEALYGGTRSLYCRSPALSRANLHRSQSVYCKPNAITTNGPLLAAPHRQSVRTQQPIVQQHQPQPQHAAQMPQHVMSHVAHTQNTLNHVQARELPLGASASTLPASSVNKPPRRPDSVYGTRRNHSVHSDDSSYGSYRGPPPPNTTYHPPPHHY